MSVLPFDDIRALIAGVPEMGEPKVRARSSLGRLGEIAAWLSCTAQRIHVPLLGFLNPAQRIDMDLLPVNDPRYIFYFFEKEYWKATEEQIKATTSSSVQFREIDHDEAATLKSIIQ